MKTMQDKIKESVGRMSPANLRGLSKGLGDRCPEFDAARDIVFDAFIDGSYLPAAEQDASRRVDWLATLANFREDEALPNRQEWDDLVARYEYCKAASA